MQEKNCAVYLMRVLGSNRTITYKLWISVEPTMLANLGQQNNQLLSQLNAGVDPTKTFGSWAKNNQRF